MTIAEALTIAAEGGYHSNGSESRETEDEGAPRAFSAWTRNEHDATGVAGVQAPWLDLHFWRALGLALGGMRGWTGNTSSIINGGDSRGTASSITSPTGTPRKPSLRVFLALSFSHPAGSPYDPRISLIHHPQALAGLAPYQPW